MSYGLIFILLASTFFIPSLMLWIGNTLNREWFMAPFIISLFLCAAVWLACAGALLVNVAVDLAD